MTSIMLTHNVDNIVPHTVTWDDHVHTLRQVLQKLRQHGLTAKPSNYEIGHAKLDLLGHVVGGGSIQPTALATSRA